MSSTGLWPRVAATISVGAALVTVIWGIAANVTEAGRRESILRRIREAEALPAGDSRRISTTLPRQCPDGSVFAAHFSGGIGQEWILDGDRSRATTTGGMLHLVGGAPTAGPRLTSARAMAGRPGLALAVVVRSSVSRVPDRPGTGIAFTQSSGAGRGTRWGWQSWQQLGAKPSVNLWAVTSADPVRPVWRVPFDNHDVLLVTVLRHQGTLALIAGHPELGALAQLTYASAVQLPGQLDVTLDAGEASAWIGAVCATQTSLDDRSIAHAWDDFQRVNHAGLDATPIGSHRWRVPTGAWTVNSGAVPGAPHSTAVVDLPSHEGLFEVGLAANPGGSIDAGLVFGFRDGENYWRWHVTEHSAALEQVAAGRVNVIYQTGAVSVAPDRAHRLLVSVNGERLGLWIDDNDALFTSTVEIAPGDLASGAGIYSGEAGTRITSFVAWPSAIQLPVALASLLPSPPQVAGQPAYVDTLQGDAGSLVGRSVAAGAAWRVLAGRWQVGPAGAVPSGTAIALLDAGSMDAAAEATVRLPASNFRAPVLSGAGGPYAGDSFPGVTVRASDAQNRVWARFLWQSGSPEIELLQSVRGQAVVLNAVNLSGRFALDADHRLRLVARGPELAAYFDDRLVVQATLDAVSYQAIRGTGVGISVDASGSPTFRSFSAWRDGGR